MFPDLIGDGWTIVFVHPESHVRMSGTVTDFFRGPIPGMSWIRVAVDGGGEILLVGSQIAREKPIIECYDPGIALA